ncbi:MAG: hypothetical protein HY910_03175 [Desulfarculus sp.]|nr:hypothetical protein [Desulfarculus sp.]
MPRTRTIYVDVQRLINSGDHASLIVRLMMASNDLALANICLSHCKNNPSSPSKQTQWGAELYFVRLQCGHLNEGLKLIQEIQGIDYLKDRIDRCSQYAQASYAKLINCTKGGNEWSEFNQYVERIRHKVTFHYANKEVSKSLSSLASKPTATIPNINAGDHITLGRFGLADDIVDNIVCRQIWKIPESANLQEEANKRADFGSKLCLAFLGFSSEFITNYILEHAAK